MPRWPHPTNCPDAAMRRFLSFCRFEPETGCVVWTGGKTQGRGHHVPYPAFWFNNRRWFAHRWAAKYIHGLDIDEYQVDHCCPNIPLPNTLCVEHVQCLTLHRNRQLQDERRKFIHIQVGVARYEDYYGEAPDEAGLLVPIYDPPLWLPTEGPTHGNDDCPF